MTSPFFGIDIALRGLQTQQGLLDVASNNIANANTPGYSRKTATVKQSTPFPSPGLSATGQYGQLGSGAEISSVNRVRDVFTDYQLRQEYATQGKWDVQRDYLAQVESVFNEPSANGLSAGFAKFWQGWQEVTNSPSDASVRASVVQQGQAVADAFQRTQAQLKRYQRDVDQEIGLNVQDVNSMASRVADLNKLIARIETSGLEASSLRDERDQLIDGISKIVKVTTVESQDGALSVYVDGRQLVDRDTATQLQAATVPGQEFTAVQWADGGRVTISDGKLKGLLDTRDTMFAGQLASLDTLAQRLIESVNGIHASGTALDGSQGNLFFTGTDASTLAVAQGVLNDLDKIAAARSTAGGDSTNALAIAQLQSVLSQRAGAATLKAGATLDGGNASVLGVDVSGAARDQSFTFSAVGGTLTISDGTNSAAFDLNVLKPTGGGVFVLDGATGMPASLGIRITINASAAAAPATMATDLAALTLRTDPTSASFSDQYATQIATLGVDSKSAQGQSSNQKALVDFLGRRRDQISQVSIDEETANLVRYQRAFQASARVMKTMDDMLNVLINGMQ